MISNLKVINITTSSVFLRWEPIENRTSFKITWNGDDANENTTTTTSTSYDITYLTAGVNYTFCVTAVIEDNKRESEPSCISTYTGMYSFKISFVASYMHKLTYYPRIIIPIPKYRTITETIAKTITVA